MLFFLEIENKEVKDMYLKDVEKLKNVMKKLELYLLC